MNHDKGYGKGCNTPAAAPTAVSGPDPSERLARTRLAILEYLQQGPPDDGARWRHLREAGRRCWRAHPWRQIVGPAGLLLAYGGRRHPLALVGIAAAAGALLVLARPWQRVSVSGPLLAALKSPPLSSLVMQLLAGARPASKTPSPSPEAPPLKPSA